MWAATGNVQEKQVSHTECDTDSSNYHHRFPLGWVGGGGGGGGGGEE